MAHDVTAPLLPIQGKSHFKNQHICDILFIFLSIFYFVFALHLWVMTKGIPGFTYTNVDEIYFADIAAFNFKHFGFLNSFFLIDYATGLDPAAHPFVYTHNIAFPNYIGAIIYKIGFDNIKYLSFFSIFFAYLGFFTVYYFFRRHFGPQLAIIVSAVIMLNYNHVLVHSILFFRSFQWMVFFLVLLSFFEWVKHRNSILFRLLFGFSISLATAYEQIVGYLLALTVIFFYSLNFPENVKKVRFFPLFVTIVVSVLTPILIQMMCLLIYFRDINIVLIDQIYTYTNRLFNWPDRAKITELYYKNGILLFGYGGPLNFKGNLKVFLNWLPQEYGILSIMSGIGIIVCYFCFSSVKIKNMLSKCFDKPACLMKSVRLTALLVLGLAVFVVVLSEHICQVYINSNVAFFEIYALLFAGIGINAIISFVFKISPVRFILVKICSIIVILFIAIENLLVRYIENPPIPMAAFDVLPKYTDKTFITNYHPQYPSIFTRQWVLPSWSSSLKDEGDLISDNYVMLKDFHLKDGKQKYAKPEYFLLLSRSTVSKGPTNLEENAELVESGFNYEIYKLK